MKSGFLNVARDGAVVTITINRPDRKNAMNQAMWREMANLYTDLARDEDARVVVLTGSGKDFCAGADISEFDKVRKDAASARAYEAENSRTFAAIRNCPLPTIAAIRGICFGGGFGLAASCDIRIADTSALFSVPAARLGLAYPADAMADIVNALGPQLTKYLVYSAARLDAQKALSARFLMELVADDLDAHVQNLAAEMAANAPLTIRATKASIRACLTGNEDELAQAVALGDSTFESEDYAEGRAAFREKRRPVFRGR